MSSKRIKAIGISVIMVLCSLSFLKCEKDDICVDGDTPLLVVRFRDGSNPDDYKSVTTLRIIGEGQDTPYSDPFTDRSTTDSLGLPLRINQPTTTFLMIADSADDEDGGETGNTDTITFNYATREVYISRACGRVAYFDGLEATINSDTENWIQSIEVINDTIENQASAHVFIYH